MISIKKYMDLNENELNRFRSPTVEDLRDSILQAYREVLTSIGDCSVQACPSIGSNLQKQLVEISARLAKSVTPTLITQSEDEVEEHLQTWGEQSSGYLHARAGDMKEILVTLAKAAQSVAERDKRYTNQFSEFTKHLQALADLEDLPQIRAAILRGAKELKTCVDKMEQDSRESMAALQTEVSSYQTRLEEAEQRASSDALTGLYNRHGVEANLQRRIGENKPFCVVMLDLNGFKQVNDAHGHAAGDDLLKQFAAELLAASRSTDAIGRWGGDEFVILLDCPFSAAKSHLGRLQKWVFGSYTLRLNSAETKVEISASVGLVERRTGETMKQVLSRADAQMYKDKAENGQPAGSLPKTRPN